MSAAPWKCYNRLQEIAERYEKSIEDLIHLASQGELVLYGCLPSGVFLRKGPGGEPISAQFVRLSRGDAQELELYGKVTLSQFDTAVSVIDGVCIEHDSVGRQLDGLVNRVFNRFSTKDGKPVTFERNDIFLIHEKNMNAILRDDLWRNPVLEIDAPPECAEAKLDSENPDVFMSDCNAATEAEDADSAASHDEMLASLFDPVKPPQLEKMFPGGGEWADHSERAARNGLIAARTGRGLFNPYLAARWWLHKQAPIGWDLARCIRVLKNNLPPRSVDSKHLLDGDYD